MAKNKLDDLAAGGIFHQKKINDIHRAIFGDVVGRESNHAPAPEQNLGTSTYQWLNSYAKRYYLGGLQVAANLFTGSSTELISGKTSEFSTRAQFLFPSSGSNAGLIKGLETNLAFKVNNIFSRLGTDLAVLSLTLAPSSQNTALVNMLTAADGVETRVIGEPWHWKLQGIDIDNIGTEISSLAGTWQSFKMGNELFIAYINASSLFPCFRGYYYDEDGNPTPREVFSNNDTITLLKTAWVFLDIDGSTVDVTYTNPHWQDDAPSSPATGDYWFDTVNETWKRYNGASFVAVDRILVGQLVLDSAACIGARSVDFFALSTKEQVIELQQDPSASTTKVSTKTPRQNSFLFGTSLQFEHSTITWNTASDFSDATRTYSVSLAAASIYYCYLDELGDTIISDFEPYYQVSTRQWEHPHENWRCVGGFRTSQSAAEVSAAVFSLPGNNRDGGRPVLFTTMELITGADESPLPADIVAADSNNGCIVITNSSGTIGEIRPVESGIYKVLFRSRFSGVGSGNPYTATFTLKHSILGTIVSRTAALVVNGGLVAEPNWLTPVWHVPLYKSSGYYYFEMTPSNINIDSNWDAGEVCLMKVSNFV